MIRPLLAAAAALGALAVAAPAAHAATCPEQPLARTFLPWLDPALYQLAPDGAFEQGGSWTLNGGAAVVDGNQPYLDGARSLALPAGSSATTAPICVTVAHPTIRFFARNTAPGPLVVSVRFTTPLGTPAELPLGTVLGGRDWTPTLPLPLLANFLTNEVRLHFAPAAGAAWQIDDVYVDPYSKG